MRLMRGDKVIIANTPSEVSDLVDFRRRAAGDVLIKGLGVGIAVQIVLAKAEVSSVSVVEISDDVIRLVPWRMRARPRDVAVIYPEIT
jgi:hypothetical protein